MAQTMANYPLEKMQLSTLIWWQVISLHLLRLQAWGRRVWAAMINEQPHRGAGLLLGGDALQCQSALAVALGSVEAALILQKLHEWIEYNRSEGRAQNKREGAWWTFNSYAAWREAHFKWMSEDKIGRQVRALEALGVIRTQQMKKRDRSKWYTIDYGRLNVLLREAKLNASVALIPVKARRDHKSETAASAPVQHEAVKAAPVKDHAAPVKAQRAPVQGHAANLHDDSSSNEAFKPKLVTQEISDVLATASGEAEPQPSPLTEKEMTEGHPSVEASAPAQERTDTASLTRSEAPLSHGSLPAPRSAPVGGEEIVNTSPKGPTTAAAAWRLAHHRLADCFDPLNYDRWMRDAWLKSYEALDGTGTYTIVAPSAEAQTMLSGRYHKYIRKELEGFNAQPIALKFEVLS